MRGEEECESERIQKRRRERRGEARRGSLDLGTGVVQWGGVVRDGDTYIFSKILKNGNPEFYNLINILRVPGTMAWHVHGMVLLLLQ